LRRVIAFGAAHEDPNVIGVAHEPVTAFPQHPVQVIEHDVPQQRRQRGPLRGPLPCRLLDPVHHDPGFQEPAHQREDLAVGDLARHPRHQRIELDPVEEPVQIDVRDPPVPVGDRPPRDPHRLVGGPAGTEPDAGPGKRWVEDRREYLRNGLLDHPIQHRGHPQQPLPSPGFGDRHPADRPRPVAAPFPRLPHGRKESSATGYTSHLLAARVQFLTGMFVVEVTAPLITRPRETDLHDVLLLHFGIWGQSEEISQPGGTAHPGQSQSGMSPRRTQRIRAANPDSAESTSIGLRTRIETKIIWSVWALAGASR
jgi:hypothetical protein